MVGRDQFVGHDPQRDATAKHFEVDQLIVGDRLAEQTPDRLRVRILVAQPLLHERLESSPRPARPVRPWKSVPSQAG